MTQAEYGMALTLFLTIAGFVGYQRMFLLRRERLKVHRYKLFQVRDELVLMVAEERVEKTDDVFQFLYRNVNQLIPQTKPLSLQKLIEGLNESEFGSITEERATIRRHIMRAVNHPQLGDVSRSMLNGVRCILLDRSVFVKLSAVSAFLGLTFMSRVRDWMDSMLAATHLDRAFDKWLFKNERQAARFNRAVRDVLKAPIPDDQRLVSAR